MEKLLGWKSDYLFDWLCCFSVTPANLWIWANNIFIISEKLADYLLTEAGVALLPGTAYGKFGDGYLRLSYANSMENIQSGISKIKTAIAKL